MKIITRNSREETGTRPENLFLKLKGYSESKWSEKNHLSFEELNPSQCIPCMKTEEQLNRRIQEPSNP
ncbi:MAG: hypothetical protein JW748_02120 [Anaerolineales bacterium]|nr:hypothetical protein [Anaerolineales bacterium]